MTQKMGGKRIPRPKFISGRHILQGLIIMLVFVSVGTFILVYQFPSTAVIELEEGQVAPNNILATQQFSYTSNIQTETAKEQARNSVLMIYNRPDPKVAKSQLERLRQIFDYLEAVRADTYGSLAEKSEWIAAIPDLMLSDIVVDQILIANEDAWSQIRQEANNILRQTMQAEIKDNQLQTARRRIPTLVALDTPDEQADVIVAIVEDLIEPNTFPDESRTELARQDAADAVEPIEITVEVNERIVTAGAVVGPEEMEALEAFIRLQQPEFSWLEQFVAPTVLMFLTAIIIGVYLIQYVPRLVSDQKRLILLAVLLLIYIALAKLTMSQGLIFAYLYPIAALSMIVVTMIDVQLSFVLTPLLALIAGFIAAEQPQSIVVYLILSGWTGALALGRNQRVNAFIWAGVYVGLVNIVSIFVFNIPLATSDTTHLGYLLIEGLLNGILLSTGLALIGLLLIGHVMGITTSIQLMDLARPNHPLLRQLLLKTPGTYHHSLMVSNLSEQAAERIGADALLVRVMAYYHDVGKMQRPYFFIENQPAGLSVHDKLEPQISAQIIISHVKDGLDLAQKYRLPRDIQAGIAQHHGTSVVGYFFHEAKKAAEETQQQVNEADFRYAGPIPQTKETGILMLADSSESAVRALKPGSAEEIDELVQKIIAGKLQSGQLDECDLTIADLYNVRTAFVDILQGVHHPRIKYPQQAKEEEKETTEKGSQSTDESQTTEGKPAVTPAPLKPLSVKPRTQSASLVRRE